MRIRITRYSGTPTVAVTALDDETSLGHTLRLVDPEVADALEALMSRLPFGGATGLNPTTDLDGLLDQAHAAARDTGDITHL